MTVLITQALVVVRDTAQRTHLVVSSPAVDTSRREVLPATALCRTAVVPSPDRSVAVWDVDCGTCIKLTGPYLELPGWEADA